ncbi:MAG: PAS domain-containing protein [Candidatus Methanoperedens sp.]
MANSQKRRWCGKNLDIGWKGIRMNNFNYTFGIKEIDMIGGIQQGSNILLNGPSMSGTDNILYHIIRENISKNETAALIVTTRESAIQILEKLKKLDPNLVLSNVGIVDCISKKHGNTAVENENIKLVSGPEDLTAIGVKISQFFEEFLIMKKIQKIQLHINSLSTLLMYSNIQTIFRLLHVLTGRIKMVNALGIYVIDREMHSEQIIASIKQLCDGMIEVNSKNDKNFIRIMGIFSQPTPKLEYQIEEERLIIVKEGGTEAQSSYEMKKGDTDEPIHDQAMLEMKNKEHIRAQFTLEELKKRYIELYDFAPVGYFIFNPEGLVKDVNFTGAVFLGLTCEKLFSCGFRRFVLPGDLKLWDHHILCTLNNWEKQSCELMLKRDDDYSLFVRLDSIQMETMEGITEIRTVMTDITHHRLREEVRPVHDYTEKIIDTVREPLIVLDGKLRVTSASNSFFQTFCLSPGETIGSCFYDIANRQWDRPKLRELLEKILPMQTKINDIEVEHEIPSIGYRKLIVNARRIPGKEGETKFILLAMEDVTEHTSKI